MRSRRAGAEAGTNSWAARIAAWASGMTAERGACGTSPARRAIRQPSRHRPRQLDDVREPPFRAHAELQRVVLTRGDGRGSVQKREDAERTHDAVRSTHAPPERIVEVGPR